MQTDPVCGMSVDENSAATARAHEGSTYYFCSAHCGAKPEKNGP
ncbi:MAG: YHS domain-containing protein [Pseudomonadota bacterium]